MPETSSPPPSPPSPSADEGFLVVGDLDRLEGREQVGLGQTGQRVEHTVRVEYLIVARAHETIRFLAVVGYLDIPFVGFGRVVFTQDDLDLGPAVFAGRQTTF